jgi:protein-tyrosine phosphatase
VITDSTDTDIRAVLPRPRGGQLVLLAYPGYVIQPNGIAIIDPERLENTFAALAALHCQTLYRLIEPCEEISDGESWIEIAATSQHIALIKLPIKDYATPNSMTLRTMQRVFAHLRQQSTTDCIAVHCHAGAGRSGMVAAWLCIQEGLSATDAIEWVRSHHPEAIETEEQVLWLRGQASGDYSSTQ